MPEQNISWMEQIETLCAGADQRHVDVIVDQAGWSMSVLPALNRMKPPMPWYSLFTNTPEEALLDDAPILMRFALDDWAQKMWLEELLNEVAPLSRLILLISPLPFETLSVRLRGLSQLEWGGQTGTLRYFDPRVLRTLLIHVLNEPQRDQFLCIAWFWGWLDRDKQRALGVGTYRGDRVLPEMKTCIELTDAQYDRMGCIGDAQKYVGELHCNWPEISRERIFSGCYQLACKASDENYFGSLQCFISKHWAELFSEEREA
jgi:hypothetical protein